jgi:hypothetical protein
MIDPGVGEHDPLIGLAGVFSFLIPGLGHLLIRAWLRGTIWIAGWIVVSSAGGGGIHQVVVALMLISGLDALLYGRSMHDPDE